MSVYHFEAGRRSALSRSHTSAQYGEPTRRQTLGMVVAAIVLIAIVPGTFWAVVAWTLWGSVGAVVAAIVALVASLFIVGLVRSSKGLEAPVPAHPVPQLTQAA